MKKPEDYIKKYCNIEYNRGLGEDVIISSLSTVITAFNEYSKDLKISLEFNDFGFGDADGEVPDKAHVVEVTVTVENQINLYKMKNKYFNPRSKKIEPLFETLCPVFTVCCRTPNIVDGDKGASVSLNVEVCGKDEARDKALLNPEFVKHIHMKNFDKNKHLDVYKPSGLYIIGRVEYNEGDPRL